jgi:hypothetical protein
MEKELLKQLSLNFKKMTVEVQKEYFSPKQCRANRNKLYVFGDNTERIGMGGQAGIRQELNSIGLATKDTCGDFFSDVNLKRNKKFINDDIFAIKESFQNDMYDTVVFPVMGLGTGLSDMQNQCPRTFLYLCERLLDEFSFNNLASLKSL